MPSTKAPTDCRYFEIDNENAADTIFPMVYEKSGTDVLWDGSVSPGNQIPPGSTEKWDLNTVTPHVRDQTVVIFGCKIKGSGKEVLDLQSQRTFVKSSQKAAFGTYNENGSFSVSDLKGGLDPAAIRDAYLKLNNPAVAKLLIAVADLISPEIAQIA